VLLITAMWRWEQRYRPKWRPRRSVSVLRPSVNVPESGQNIRPEGFDKLIAAVKDFLRGNIPQVRCHDPG
jgi:hypothetical protein